MPITQLILKYVDLRKLYLNINSLFYVVFLSALFQVGACGQGGQDFSHGSELSIEIFHGLSQRVGHLGDAQADFNLVGRVSPPARVKALTYSLNGAAAKPLVVPYRTDGFGDGRRLAANGDFNADIPIQSLEVGSNLVKLIATSLDGHAKVVEISIYRQEGTSPLSSRINWNKVKDPQDVGQYIDGKWGLEQRGLRVLRSGYDRIFLIGDIGWKDYEVRVSVVVHRVDQVTGPNSGSNGLGFIMRFAGHVVGGHRNFPFSQPKYGYQPFGAIGWLRWVGGPDADPQAQYYRGDNDKRRDYGAVPIALETPYVMKMRCETLPDTPDGQGVTRYSWKMWPSGEAEPSRWAWQQTQISKNALRQGGVALVAHHVEATFGDVNVESLSGR